MKLNLGTTKHELTLAFTFTQEGKELSTKQQATLLKFMLLFNVFEGALFTGSRSQDANCKEICANLAKCEDWFKIEDYYDEYGVFFVERFTKNGEYNDNNLFGGRRPQPDIGKTVKKVIEKLKNGDKDNGELFYSYLQIAFRYRNKLFHGEKTAFGLDQQIACFDKINWMMNKLLGDMMDHQFVGLNKEISKNIRIVKGDKNYD